MKLICPNCGKEVEHEIVAYRQLKKGMEYTVKCNNCGYTYKKITKEDKMVDVKVIWSMGEKTEVKKITVFEDDIIGVDDELLVDGVPSLVTAVDSGGSRMKEAMAKDINAVWAKRFDKVIVKVSVNHGRKTTAHEIIATPDEEFYIGDIVDLNDIHAVISKIKSKDRFITRGGEIARNIVRIYAKEIR